MGQMSETAERAQEEDQKSVSTEEGAHLKKNKKRVSWAEEPQLKQVFYFELDETERGTVSSSCLF